jgi:capsular polysaccharide transport system permease protein
VGAVWTLLEPLAHMLLLVGILGAIRSNPGLAYEYPVFLVTGLIPFFLFQNLANRLMDAIEANRGLYAYRQVKPLDTMVSRALVESVMNLLVYAFTLGIMGWVGFHVMPHQPLEMLGVNLLLILFGGAFGLFAAVLSHDRPRLRSLIRMFMFPLYLASGVIFPVTTLPRQYVEILLWNPLLHLVELSRHAFIPEYALTQGVNALYPTLVMLCLAAMGLLLYQSKRQALVST